jgi:peptidoglycan hydrolase-like protein with peptidoglycan-binding domain
MACGAGPAPSLKNLWAELSAAFPGRVEYLGICGDSSHAARKSAHNEGNALDVGVGSDHDLGWGIINHFLADGRAYNAIHQGKGRRANWRGGSWFSASGHENHIHLEIHNGGRGGGGWGFSAATAPAPSPSSASTTSSSDYGNDWHDTGRGRIMKRGHKGAAVRHLQNLLNAFGFDAGTADGDFGPRTEAAVKRHQAASGLAQDGLVGPASYNDLEDRHYLRGRYAPPPVPPFPGQVQRGSRGDAVRQVQQRLRDRGWSIGVDGQFGPGTERIIRAFQTEKGLTPDGIAGPRTWNALWSSPVT